MALPPAAPCAALAAPRILVAEDNPVLRIAIQGLIRSMGHSVKVVASGPDALEAASARDYDLVLLDIQMPEMDGIETAQKIRGLAARVREPRIVMMSADPYARESCSIAGMGEFLAKPILRRDLIGVLSSPSLTPS